MKVETSIRRRRYMRVGIGSAFLRALLDLANALRTEGGGETPMASARPAS